MYSNIMVIFDNNDTRLKIVDILKNSGITPNVVSSNGNDILRNCIYNNEGLIISSYKYSDNNTINTIIDSVPIAYKFILIAPLAEINNCNNERIFTLVSPVKVNEILSYINLFSNNSNYIENNIILKAKKILMDKYNLSEPEAHKYLQKKSMENGIKTIDIARLILKKSG